MPDTIPPIESTAGVPATDSTTTVTSPQVELPLSDNVAKTDATTDTDPNAAKVEDGTDKTEADSKDDADAPEPYEPFELPDGFALEGDRLQEATGFFRELGLNQEQAQKAVTQFTKLASEDAGAIKGFLEAERSQRIQDWGEQSRKEFGDKFESIASDARAAVEWAKKERPGLLETYDAEGWGNNPDALWAMAQLGRLTRGSSMDGINGETVTAGEPKPLESRMYPNMNP